ncbi:hypothetical protein FACS1894109_19130 [Spirochaetia bacterium]|nr:hypothetical protein FACS1894109_19130 [Spirochaetia bacterium]
MNRKSVFSKTALAATLVGMLGLCLVFTACPPGDGDITAPVLSLGSVSDLSTAAGTTATLKFSSDEAGTYYYVVLAASDAVPDEATVKAQGTAAAKGTAAATAAVNTIAVTGLTPSSTYTAYIVVEDAAGNLSTVLTISGVNPVVTGTPDITAPVFVSAAINGTTLVITLSETATGTPDTGDFTVNGISGNPAVSNAVVSENSITLTLASAAANGEAVTVSYVQSANASEQIKDTAGNLLAAFTDETVTNNTGIPKTVTAIGVQSGSLTYGTTGSSTFAVTTGGITGSVPASLSWFSNALGTTTTTAPGGVTVSTPVNVSGSSTNITVNTTNATPAGTYYFRALIDGETSTGVGTVTVAKKPLTNSDLEVTGSVNAKSYDGTTTATGLTIGIKAASKVGSDDGTITGINYAFASANAGTSVAITFSGTPALSVAASANYTLSGINLGTAPFAGKTGTINKATGAAVSGGPIVSGTPTTSSITVNAVTVPSNPGSQTVEYAISTVATGITIETWQGGTTFNSGLSAGTPYYVYARTKADTNYDAGTAQRSAAISTAEPTGTRTVTVTLWTDDATIFASTTDSVTLSRSAAQTALITGLSTSEYSNHRWSVNGAPEATGTTFTFDSTGRDNGQYNIGLQVQKNGSAWYSTTITITVEI